jgi:hypothetical protein
MRVKIVVVGEAVLLGAWFYADQKQGDLYSQGVYDFLYSWPVSLALVGSAVAVGFTVGRWWAFLSLIGPLLSLGYLQVTGYISPWHDGIAPLWSLPTLAGFIWFGLYLFLGLGMRRLWRTFAKRSREAPG